MSRVLKIPEYDTITVSLQELGEDRYTAIVHGRSGDGRSEFELPLGEEELDALAAAVSRPRGAWRRIESDQTATAREFGTKLFDLVFQDTAGDVLRASRAEARSRHAGLRLMLELDGARNLRNVPWELLWDSPNFFSIAPDTPVVRYVQLTERRPPPLRVQAPLRILGVVSNPENSPTLDVAGEQARLTEACLPLAEEGVLEIEWVPRATFRGLNESLSKGEYHIFHFIGHGEFDEEADDGVLLFETSAARTDPISSTNLATILAGHLSLRLAVINACEGARVAADSSGIATSLVNHRLPAVIAMQFEISDTAALSFAGGFYTSLARSNPIDKALTDARLAMFAGGHGLQWATPVLFTSINDSRLFDLQVEKLSPRPVKPQPAPAPYVSGIPKPVPAAYDYPDPEYRVAPTLSKGADPAARVRAATYDVILLVIVYSVLAQSIKNVGYGLGLLFIFAYYTYLEGRWGQTLGKRLMRLRVVDADTYGPIGFRRACILVIGRWACLLTIMIPYLWMFVDPRKQSLYDKLAKSLVVPA